MKHSVVRIKKKGNKNEILKSSFLNEWDIWNTFFNSSQLYYLKGTVAKKKKVELMRIELN